MDERVIADIRIPGLTKRAKRYLSEHAGVMTVGQLAQLDDATVLRAYYVGRKGLPKIRDWLNENVKD